MEKSALEKAEVRVESATSDARVIALSNLAIVEAINNQTKELIEIKAMIKEACEDLPSS